MLDFDLGLNASGSESEEGEGGGRPVVLLVRTNLPPALKLSAFLRAFSLLLCKLFTSPLVALLLGLAPCFLSGLSVHHEDLPAPSF